MSLLKIKNLHTYFETPKGLIKAVKGISFELQKGKTLGIFGESGSGKSQTAISILKLLNYNQKIYQGEIIFNEQVISRYTQKQMEKIRGNEIAMIFQDALSSLNPVFKIKNQMMEILQLHKNMNDLEGHQKILEILQKVKIHDAKRVMNAYPHQLSGGMCQRVMISMALICEPKLLIADEPTTALDVITQKEILNLINELQKEFQTSVLFITHDLGVISQIVDDIIVMYEGQIVEKGPVQTILTQPKHNYTKSLLNNFLKTSFL
ncbi:ABC transporter ATP-binding protein [Candidatus Phytoplasma phoenicium]|uniref:ABC-type dipeptide/oligopeptide transport system, ATPase component n=1 Tax=Candidatus Phytoplasma phoenicium TaxID=198422 RepID=A0A0L0MK81_9MOLU|nr:ABC transporter ATP-binding protein [Candidatus Phytoplasma phoenicium]KND62700.1 ABC-type dipeptide/oligopeptide transport system, ATPase component [Candidatus Phytoplasma phoenicium]